MEQNFYPPNVSFKQAVESSLNEILPNKIMDLEWDNVSVLVVGGGGSGGGYGGGGGGGGGYSYNASYSVTSTSGQGGQGGRTRGQTLHSHSVRNSPHHFHHFRLL